MISNIALFDKVKDYLVRFGVPPTLDFGRKKHKFRECGSTKTKKDKEKAKKINKISKKSRKRNR